MAQTELQYVARYLPVVLRVYCSSNKRNCDKSTIEILMFTNTKMNIYAIK